MKTTKLPQAHYPLTSRMTHPKGVCVILEGKGIIIRVGFFTRPHSLSLVPRDKPPRLARWR